METTTRILFLARALLSGRAIPDRPSHVSGRRGLLDRNEDSARRAGCWTTCFDRGGTLDVAMLCAAMDGGDPCLPGGVNHGPLGNAGSSRQWFRFKGCRRCGFFCWFCRWFQWPTIQWPGRWNGGFATGWLERWGSGCTNSRQRRCHVSRGEA